jgi:hypothetical protein
MARKTIEKRLLNAFKGGDSLNKMQLRQKLRIPRTELNEVWFDNSFMRTVRKMTSKGQLTRVSKGVYTICRN